MSSPATTTLSSLATEGCLTTGDPDRPGEGRRPRIVEVGGHSDLGVEGIESVIYDFPDDLEPTRLARPMRGPSPRKRERIEVSVAARALPTAEPREARRWDLKIGYLTPEEVGRKLRRNPEVVRRWCREKKLPARHLADSGHWRIHPLDLEDYLSDGVPNKACASESRIVIARDIIDAAVRREGISPKKRGRLTSHSSRAGSASR